jgi:hydroxymethylglutaryl-CoA reductase (NADPH)
MFPKKIASKLVYKSVNNPANKSANNPANESVNNPANESVNKPVNNPANNPVKNSVSGILPSLRGQQSATQKEQIFWRQNQIRAVLSVDANNFSSLFDYTLDAEQVAAKNCENMIGSVEIPVGLAGPVLVSQVHSSTAKNQFPTHELYIPLATTEGALVASTSRGCKAITQSGGAAVMLKNNGMTRAPVFACQSGVQAEEFGEWLAQPAQQTMLKTLSEQTSNYLTYLKHESYVRGKQLYTRFYFDTDEAMGMNMVTIALQHALAKMLDMYHQSENHAQVRLVSISGNVCADKKSSYINTLLGRGRWLQAEVVIPTAVLSEVLKIQDESVESIVQAHVAKNLVGSNVAGSFAQNMQAANVVAAFYAATGQDVAHVVDSSMAFTSVEKVDAGLYVSVTLPNIIIGSVGGGTYLPAQKQAQQIIRPHLPASHHISADQLAISLGVGVLAAEISGLAALATNTLAQAHASLARSSSKESEKK